MGYYDMSKQLEAVGVASGNFETVEAARGHTYTTVDNKFPPTPLIFADNPFNDKVRSAKIILDVGCGVGRNLPWILDNTTAYYIGLDPNPSMRKAFLELQADKLCDRVSLCGSFDEIDTVLGDQTIDYVVCTFVFQHIGFRTAPDQMNITDITQAVFKRSTPKAPWMLFEHEGEELWMIPWALQNKILPTVLIRNYRGIPELTHRGPHDLILFETP